MRYGTSIQKIEFVSNMIQSTSSIAKSSIPHFLLSPTEKQAS